MEANTNLKSCPFCGGEAYIESGLDAADDKVYRIGCASPICGMRPRMAFFSEEEAIEAWNRRASGSTG